MDGNDVITVLDMDAVIGLWGDDEDGRRGQKTQGPIQRNFDSQQNNNVPFPFPDNDYRRESPGNNVEAY